MGPGTADTHVVPAAHRQAVTRGANLVLADGLVAGTWIRKAGTLTVAWLAGADPPDHDLLREEATRLAAVIGTEPRAAPRSRLVGSTPVGAGLDARPRWSLVVPTRPGRRAPERRSAAGPIPGTTIGGPPKPWW